MSDRDLITLADGSTFTPVELEAINRPPQHENPVSHDGYPELGTAEDPDGTS